MTLTLFCLAGFAVGFVVSGFARQGPELLDVCDWDGESWCANGCKLPATHQILAGCTSDDTPIMELVCCGCAGAA